MSEEPKLENEAQDEGVRDAKLSRILGIVALPLSLAYVGSFVGLIAVIVGWTAISRLKRTGGVQNEMRRRAKVGVLLGFLSFVFPLLVFISFQFKMRHSQEGSRRHHCINQLRLIDAAKQQWALEKGKDSTASPTESEILPYLGRGSSPLMLVCPAGGTYEINVLTNPPTCTIPEHVLPE